MGARAEFLRETVAEELRDRVVSITRSFEAGLELGGAGAFSRVWASDRELQSKIDWLASSDLAEGFARRAAAPALVADEERLPLAEASLDLIVAPLGLHWVNDLPGALIQIRRALKPDGVFLGAMVGGATLSALRAAFLSAETDAKGGAAMRVSPFADVQDMSALLQRAGFALPVADVERATVRYADPFAVLRDLRAMGETAAPAQAPPHALTRSVLLDALARFANAARDPDGRIRVDVEVIHAIGWAPHESQPKALRPGSATTRLADALGVKEISAGEKAGR